MPPAVLYVLRRSITESPNANEYQRPLGLARGFRVTLLVPAGATVPPEIRNRLRVVELECRDTRHKSPLWLVSYILAATKNTLHVSSRIRADAICTGTDEASLAIGWLIKIALRLPWIVFCWDHPYPVQAERTDLLSRLLGKTRRTIIRFFLNRSSMVCCNIAPGMLEELRVANSRVFFLPNGVALNRIAKARDKGAVDGRLIGVVANVSKEKGAGLAVEALHVVRKNCPDARLRLIGEVDCAFREELCGVIRKLGLDSAVEITEWQPHERAMEHAAECCICVYAYKPLPRFYWNYVLKIGEYFALGKPVVAVDTPGAREYVKDGDNGFLVEPENPDAMAKAICKLLGDQTLRRRMGRRAREAAAEYDWNKIHDRMNEEIISVLRASNRMTRPVGLRLGPEVQRGSRGILLEAPKQERF